MADETCQGSKPKSVDAGGNRPDKPNTERYECLRCDTVQVESRGARNRAAKVSCRHCGNTVYPVISAPDKRPAAKFCKSCKAKLRAGNSKALCSLCDR